MPMLKTRSGDTINEPTPEQLETELDALYPLPPDGKGHEDVFVTNQIDGNDWFIRLEDTGHVTMTIMDYSVPAGSAESIKTYGLGNVSREELLEMWQELLRGEGEKIQGRPWNVAYAPFRE